MASNSFVVEVYSADDLIYRSQPLPLDSTLEIYHDTSRKFLSGLIGGGWDMSGMFQTYSERWFDDRMKRMKHEWKMDEKAITDFILSIGQTYRKGHVTIKYFHSSKIIEHES